MKRLAIAVLLPACHADLEPPWQLDHDRIVAVRATPPHVAAGAVAILDALVAHAGAPTTIGSPTGATASGAPGGLFTAVHFVFDHWEIDAPDDAGLAPARAELGLAADAPVPLDVTIVFGPLVAKKRVWLGDSLPNPALPEILIDGAPPGAVIDVPRDRELALEANAGDVRWLSSVGTLVDDELPVASLAPPEGPQDGELAVVIRDDTGGVVWQVWPASSH